MVIDAVNPIELNFYERHIGFSSNEASDDELVKLSDKETYIIWLWRFAYLELEKELNLHKIISLRILFKFQGNLDLCEV